MNFLAHIFLSGENDEILFGNFIGDAVKGKDFSRFPDLVRKGLYLHRFIDSFTDTHPVVRKSKNLLNNHYHKYSGVVVDIFYDYFLTLYWDMFSEEPRREFIYRKNDVLFLQSPRFPREVKRLFPCFILNNWLETYATVSGIEKVLRGMSKKTSLPDETDFAIHLLDDRFDDFRDHFLEFFPQIIEAVSERFDLRLPMNSSPKEFQPRA